MLVFNIAIQPFILIFGVVAGDFDAPYFYLNLILQPPAYREMFTIIASICFRLVIGLVFAVEFARNLSFLLCYVFILIHRSKLIFDILVVVKTRQFPKCFYYYKCFFLALRKIESWFNTVVYIGLLAQFWAVVESCWICVKLSPEDISLPLYLFFVALFILIGITGHLMVIPFVCNLAETILFSLEIHSLKRKLVYIKRKTKGNKFMMLQAQSLYPYRIRYGPYYYLGKEFDTDNLWTLVERCIDTCLVFD